MSRLLESFKFWKKSNKQNNASSSISTTTTSATPSFLVPDLDDITPFLHLQPQNKPISMRQLLVAIAQDSSNKNNVSPNNINILINRPSNNQIPKRKLDHHHPTNQPTPHAPHAYPSKRPRLLSNHLIQPPKSNHLPQPLHPPPTQLVHGLPPHVWYLIFLYNQLETLQDLVPPIQSSFAPTPNPSCNTPCSSRLTLALDAQQHRHDMSRLSKSLSPIANRAAWSILLLGTLKMLDKVAHRFEANTQLTSHLHTCIILYLPTTTPNQTKHALTTSPNPQLSHPSTQSPSLPVPSATKPNPRIPKPKKNSYHPHPPAAQPHPHAKHRLPASNPSNTPTSRRPLPIKRASVPSPSIKKTQKFHSVLIPPLPLSNLSETSRNTKINSARTTTRPQAASTIEKQAFLVEYDEQEYFEHTILASSLPSLFLSIARSVQVCCVVGDERLATRALKSLSVLSSLLTSLVQLFIDGGGRFNDLSTLVEGLPSITIRGQSGSLRVLSITGPSSTLSIPTRHHPLATNRSCYPSNLSQELSTRSTSSTGSLYRSTRPSNSSTHLSIQHLILGNGIPLTAEQLHWLITSVTPSEPALKTLRVTLTSAGETVTSLSSSTSSEASRKTPSSRALLGRTFERIGPGLEGLAIFEDWKAPLTSTLRNTRRVTFEGGGGGCSGGGGGVLDEPLVFCRNLESLSLTHGRLCSVGLLNVLPFTLKTIEIHEGLGDGNGFAGASSDEDGANAGFNLDDIWLARSQAALFGLEKIRIVASSSHSSTAHGCRFFNSWKRAGGSNGFENLLKTGVQFDFLSSSNSVP